MSPVASPSVKWFGKGLLACLKNDVDLEGDTIKLTLHTSAYVPNLDTDDFYDDAIGELATASGYTSGGVTLAGKALSYDADSNRLLFTFTDPSWTFTAEKTFRYGVLRKARGGAATADELVALLDWGIDQAETGTYTFDATPIALFTPTDTWVPTIDDIAIVLRARTKPTDGQVPAGVFNASTSPTGDQVQAVIDRVVSDDIEAVFASGEVPESSWKAARTAAILKTAYSVEASYFPEEVDEAGANGTQMSLSRQADAAMKTLVNGANVRSLFSEAA